ncbi:hypothetical protein WA026_014774 [Henosepilachna vigintioctopunctata]|uniref:Uncharacterized protein n=1 Tax=Henosepilachna vigintioctopunctata TaxID=420089 RepID=A0AAW1UY26_9CUCU
MSGVMMSSKYIVILAIFANAARSDDYVDELQQRCNITMKSYSCTKYKLFDFLDRYGLVPDNAPRTLGGFVRFVKLATPKIDTGMFQKSRYLVGDTETMKIIKFAQRKVDQFLGSQGLAFLLPEGAAILDVDSNSLDEGESRGRKKGSKKKEMLIPLIMLFKLFKIKVLVTLVLLAVLFIKKQSLSLRCFFLQLFSQSRTIVNYLTTWYHIT